MDLQSTAGMSEKRTPFHREGDRAPDAGRPEFCSSPCSTACSSCSTPDTRRATNGPSHTDREDNPVGIFTLSKRRLGY